MSYTEKQIENAKVNYINFLKIRTVEDEQPEYVGYSVAQQRSEYHNNIVNSILAGNKELEKKWKLFFLKEQVSIDNKVTESKAKKESNKLASTDILAPIKEAKKLVEFGKWLNKPNNKFRKEHFSKKYTIESVTEFLSNN